MEWISTKDKKPQEFQDVLLYQENNGIFIGWLENNLWVVDNTFVEAEDFKTVIRGNIRQEEITYWRPLPANPLWDFFDTELKTCQNWYNQCSGKIKILDYKQDINEDNFRFFWTEEMVCREEFVKRLTDMEIERLK